MVGYIFALVAALLYSIASARLVVALSRAQPAPTGGILNSSPPNTSPSKEHYGRRNTLLLASAALLLHGWLVALQTGIPFELQLPFFTAIGVTTLVIVALQLILCLRQPADYLGLAVYPISAIAVLASEVAKSPVPDVDLSIRVHVMLSITAYAILALAAAQAGLVAIQRNRLASHKPGGFIRALPPFDRTETLLFALLAAGFFMLTLSLLSGFAYLNDMFAQHLAHKTVLSCVAWTIFAALLIGRWLWGWRGRRAVNWTLGGFLVLILAYFGSKLVLELILQRG